VDVPLEYDAAAGGYVASFDVRDPGTYTLQIVVSWYFGRADPWESVPSLRVGRPGSRMVFYDFRRSMIDGGELLTVVLPETAVPRMPSRFGFTQCTSSAIGRWMYYSGRPCEVPYCVGDIDEVIPWEWVGCVGFC
jgi:hypothetical protein